jgi:predicted dehydrogenase
MNKLRWGILGAGKFAGTFAKGIAASQTGTVVAIGSRTQENAERFGEEYNVPNRHGSYEALVADPEVDVVHISLPNHLHAEWTIQCAQAGKHILCEKPFTVNHAEAVETFAKLAEYDVFFMEAFMYRCHPQTWKLKELLDAKTIGEVRLIQVNFCYNMGSSESSLRNIRMRNDVAGGGIMDVGCYTMSMARLVAGAEPEVVQGAAHIGPISRVDEQATASLRFPNGAVANLACATQVGADNSLRIFGSEGSIVVPNPWFPGESGNKIIVTKSGESPNEIIVEGGLPLYAIETDTVAKYLEAREAPSPCMTKQDTLGNMAGLDAWRKSVGLIFDVEKG